MEKKNRELNYKLAMTGIMGALSIVLAITPLGYISLGGLLTITTMHIPAILTTIIAGLPSGMCVGAIFGITSLIRTVMTGGGAAPFFMNPLVSVLPRLLFPIAVYAIYKLMSIIPKMPRILSGAIAAGFGTFFHTLLVMGAIYILYGQKLLSGMSIALSSLGYDVKELNGLEGFIAIIVCTMATNGLWEIIGAIILTTAVLSSMYITKGKKSKLSRREELLPSEEPS